ncbi:MAG: hypothetical protein J2P28_15240, partial [Actinobacteria bacterium]|nr:hypothetical protein [Actinomycetota bacterium]
MPVIDAMFILFLLGLLSERKRQALGTIRDLRYQASLATLVLVIAVFEAEAWLTQLRAEGLLGSTLTDYYVAWVGLVAGSAATLGLGWLVARYGLLVTPVRGWLFFLAADFLSYWAYWAKADWDQINPRSLSNIWPVAANAAIVVISLMLLAVLLKVRRRIPLHLPPGPPYRMPDEALSLPLLMGGGLFPAVMADVGVNAVNSAIQLVHGPPLPDLATAGLLFLLGLGSVAFLQRASFNPDVVASNLRKGFARIPGIRPGEATAAYIRRRVTLLTVIAAPWFAVLL